MPKRTFQANKSKKIKKLGFRKKMSSKAGRDTIKRRKIKGRKRLTS